MYLQSLSYFPQKSTAYRLWIVLLLSSALLGLFAFLTQPSARVIVHFTSDSTLSEREAWLRPYDVIVSIDTLDAVVIDTAQAPDIIRVDSIIAWAEFDAPITLAQDSVHPSGVIAHEMQPAPPPDPYYADQWNLQAVSAPDAWMRLPQQHDVRVAIIDSGICMAHDEFSQATLTGYDFIDEDSIPQDEHGHGCGVAGVIGATRQNEIGIAGLLNGAELMALRIADEDGVGYVSTVARALIFASDHNADVINLSLGTPEDTVILRKAIEYTSHIPTVASIGSDETSYYPASYNSVIAVGSYDEKRQIIATDGADYYAPGINILTTGLNNQIVEMSGTSVASAHITGMIALEMLSDGEMILGVDGLSQLIANENPMRPSGARQIKVFTIIYESSTPLYDPLKLNALTLSDMTRSTISHGYDNPEGQPALEFVQAIEPIVVNGAPPPPDPNYDATYNYAAIYDNFDLCERIQRYEVDEIWIWGEANPAYGHGLEWVTNGPQLQWTWGSNVPDCGRTITTMWFEYNREVALALHSYGHRMEGAFMMRTPCQFMTANYPWAGEEWLDHEGRGQECDDSLSDHTGFVARTHRDNGNISACGDVHSPPNVLPAIGAYHYEETTMVRSMCEDWQRDGSATWETFNCERWNCNERDYHTWWKQNIPSIGYEHRDTDGTILPNWYDYLYDIHE